MKTFAELYCERQHVRPGYFERHVLHRCLYPWARWSQFLLSLLPDYFEADLELIRAAGRLTSIAGLPAEVAEFHYHPANSGRLRREWRLRLSVMRLHELVAATLPVRGTSVESMAPFDVQEVPGAKKAAAVRVVR